ncbi:hypothetical protein LCGC14_2628730, partial [marine sediment metagenome]
MSDGLRVGVASVDITPDYPVGLSGYAAREGLSTGVLDPVHARAAVFDRGAARIVIVTLDLMDITREQADALRQVAAKHAQTAVDAEVVVHPVAQQAGQSVRVKIGLRA